MFRLRRRNGQTLGLVAIVVFVIIVIGTAVFFLSKIMGGGRELANATDSGSLNIAKQAIRNPGKTPFSFTNANIGTNFAGLVDDNGNLDLLVYNRLVAQATIVALNARDENTTAAAADAKAVWQALADVGTYLTDDLSSDGRMGQYFTDLSQVNNVRMLGGNNISMSNYGTAYMKRGESSNVAINTNILDAFSTAPSLPANEAGQASKSGFKYLSGYQPFSIDLPAAGDKLTFCAVSTLPQQSPHLVSFTDFKASTNPASINGLGGAFASLPPNSFLAAGKTKESKTNLFAGAVSCAIVGSVNKEFSFQIPQGYIIIQNGPPGVAPAGPFANDTTEKDIFAHELSTGIITNGSVFIKGPKSGVRGMRGYDWAVYNRKRRENKKREAAGLPPEPIGPMPPIDDFFNSNGDPATIGDCETIFESLATVPFCHYFGYKDPPDCQLCVDMLPAFKKGYDRPGDVDNGNITSSQFTNLEVFKAEILASRVTVKTCTTVAAPAGFSGVKWFEHGQNYPRPKVPINFGVVKSALDYLRMIDQVSAGCGSTTTLESVTKRCQQILPGTSIATVKGVLASKELPLGKALYLYAAGGTLTLNENPPPWVVAGTTVDGTARPCGESYELSGLANLDKESDFPVPYADEPAMNCKDSAIWTPSSGYNNLLGSLTFRNDCAGGGSFCQPN